MNTHTTARGLIAAVLLLGGSGCMTPTLIDHWNGEGAYNPHSQPLSLQHAEEGPDGLWLTALYGDGRPHTVLVRPAPLDTASAEPPLGRFVSMSGVSAGRPLRGLWLEGREVWRESPSGDACVARLPTLNDPLGRGPTPPSAGKRFALGLLFPFAAVADSVLVVAALAIAPVTLPLWVGGFF